MALQLFAKVNTAGHHKILNIQKQNVQQVSKSSKITICKCAQKICHQCNDQSPLEHMIQVDLKSLSQYCFRSRIKDPLKDTSCTQWHQVSKANKQWHLQCGWFFKQTTLQVLGNMYITDNNHNISHIQIILKIEYSFLHAQAWLLNCKDRKTECNSLNKRMDSPLCAVRTE